MQDERNVYRLLEQMNPVDRRTFLKLLGATSAGAFLQACAGATPAPPQVGAPTQAPATAAPPTAAETVLTVLQGVDPVSLDPQVGESGPKINVLIHMFDSLTAINDDMEIVPQAATSWEAQEDNLTWRFELRDDVTFWNGEPLDANAVKYTMDRMRDEDLRGQGLNDPFPARVELDAVNVIDDYTVDLVTKSPQPLMALWLTYVFILEPSHYDSISFDEASINPMGSGAFNFIEWVRDDHVSMERNPDWWDGQPEISQLVFRPVPEGSVRLNELETGGADLITDVRPEDMERVDAIETAHIASVEGGRRVHIGFNLQREYLVDQRVRQAFNYAVNWDEISEALLNGLGSRLVTVSSGWVPDDMHAYPYDPDQAEALLEEAGFPMDQQLVLNTPNGRYLKDVEIAQAVAAQLGQIGVQVEVIPLEWSVMNENIQNRTMEDLYLLGLGSRFNGLQDITSLRPDALFNPGGWSNERFNELLDEAQSYLDVDDQKPLVQDAMRVAYDDPPWIFLWRQVAIYGASNRLSAWNPRPDERIRLDHVALQ